MKLFQNLPVSLLILMLAALAYCAYRFTEEFWIDLPSYRVISTVDGKSLPVTVVGRTGAQIWVKNPRDVDAVPYRIEVDQLSPSDRSFVIRLPSKLLLPVSVPLANREGTRIDAVILGRTETHLSIRKSQDWKGKLYQVPISSLSDADQRLVSYIPIHAVKEDSAVLLGKKRALQREEAKLLGLRAELNKTGIGSSQTAQLDKWQRISETAQDISKLRSDIQMMEAQETK